MLIQQKDEHIKLRQKKLTALTQLQSVLNNYLEEHPNLSLNGLSKKCSISEPTLRRIRKGHFKSLPSVPTVISLLSYICKETETESIMNHFSGPLAEWIQSKAQQVEDFKGIEFSDFLTQSLRDPIKYLIYKLACSDKGVAEDKIVQLFGSYGEKQILNLMKEDLIFSNNKMYHAKIKNFALSNDVFVDHFKTMADFIKPHKHANANKDFSPIFNNYSGTITKQAYKQILKVQRSATKKIATILNKPQNQGHIPTFFINAVDTIDDQCADEFEDS